MSKQALPKKGDKLRITSHC